MYENRNDTLVELWERYSSLLWEDSKHKEACGTYIDEIHRFMLKSGHKNYDNVLLDKLTVHFRQKGNRNSTINRKFASLSKILRKHHRNGELGRLPEFKKLPERNARIRFFTPDEEQNMLNELEEIDPHYAQLSRFLVESGARIGEALKLNWCDIDGDYVTFWETKSSQPRTIPLSERARKVIAEQRKKRSRKSGPFQDIPYYKFRGGWNSAKERTHMRDDRNVVPHVLRHTCASRLAQSGVDIKRIQEFLGHRTLSMTLRYAHLSPKHLDVCAEALNNFKS
ncbi:site-specific integrase [Hoeflea prorocentri]|uniref:Site-specific integrase n=1 Tax=Hoeflea prorocentri TaxID=1922333 RepID=A0A9X3ZI49_9HYPH|nr:site-specific integrase [Hoeflea prorocentri]MCY6381481.1 site-specific integrase [Hoeflea prorocentri]MDA5399281.1 site-specific integrase [Hoeflea prorocentri]